MRDWESVSALNFSHDCFVSDQPLYMNNSAQLRPAGLCLRCCCGCCCCCWHQALSPVIAKARITMERSFSSGMLVIMLRLQF